MPCQCKVCPLGLERMGTSPSSRSGGWVSKESCGVLGHRVPSSLRARASLRAKLRAETATEREQIHS